MNSVTPTPTPTPSQTPTNNLNSSLLEADLAIGIIMVILGVFFIILAIGVLFSDIEFNILDATSLKENLLLILYAVIIICSGVFLIFTSQNINRYIDVKQNSVNKNDITYGIIYLVLSLLILLLLVVIYYYSSRKLNFGYFPYLIIFGFIATLMGIGIKYILSGEFAS